MPQLENPKHERFAQEVSKGGSPAKIYMSIYGCSKESANSSGYRLLDDADISDRVNELQKTAAEKSILTISEMHDFLARAVKTPIKEINEESDLAQEVSYTEHGTTIKSVSKLKALETSARLQGLLVDRQEVTVDDRRSVSKEERKALLEAAKARRGGKS